LRISGKQYLAWPLTLFSAYLLLSGQLAEPPGRWLTVAPSFSFNFSPDFSFNFNFGYESESSSWPAAGGPPECLPYALTPFRPKRQTANSTGLKTTSGQTKRQTGQEARGQLSTAGDQLLARGYLVDRLLLTLWSKIYCLHT